MMDSGIIIDEDHFESSTVFERQTPSDIVKKTSLVNFRFFKIFPKRRPTTPMETFDANDNAVLE